MDVSENSGTPKSSILIGVSIINHPFWGSPIFGNTYIYTVYLIFHYFLFPLGLDCHPCGLVASALQDQYPTRSTDTRRGGWSTRWKHTVDGCYGPTWTLGTGHRQLGVWSGSTNGGSARCLDWTVPDLWKLCDQGWRISSNEQDVDVYLQNFDPNPTSNQQWQVATNKVDRVPFGLIYKTMILPYPTKIGWQNGGYDSPAVCFYCTMFHQKNLYSLQPQRSRV